MTRCFGNSATFGGGIGNHATVMLTNVTIAGNSAVDGGGGIADGGTATLNNSLLASNSGGDIDFGTVNGDNNLVDDAANAGGLTNGTNGNIVGVNPLLAAAGNYGGPTQTIALLPGSPAIDAGDTALAVDAEGNPLTTDQRGLPRVVGSAVDIGAFESSGFTLAIVAGNDQSTPITTPFPTALEVSVTPNNPGDPVDGGVVTFTPPASGASATLVPSGPVTITSGTASVTATANGIPGGPYSVTAATAGASPVSFSLSNTGQSTLTSFSSSLNPSIYGESVTFTASVKAVPPGSGTPTGTVTFMDGSTSLETVASLADEATFATSFLDAGSHTITVVYNGDGNFLTSTSAPLNQTVKQASTTTKLTSSLNPSVYGEDVTFTATVAANAPGSGSPTGTVTFMAGSAVLGTGTVSGGVATFSTSTLTVGVHSITAVYSGDTNFKTSKSAILARK